ncbi:TetR/AcrR family transcriptional regulator [Listeria costaricensis]|uniref:TetR/AcrR family transcriptional regulator n=1 Tax=Listeria costaricensis TaxID=2026604 RepID=UPI000C07B55A|nr:TetR/AcrR family transcriptional regulator [Listeria costaricensis]
MKDKKRKIITEAKTIFRKKGYLLTSAADIVEASGISKGTFYNYFTSKEELAIVIFKQEYSVLHQKLERMMADETHTKKENFMATMNVLIEFHSKNAEILNITFSQAMVDDDFNQFLASVRLRSLEWVKKQILLIYGAETEPYVNDLTLLLVGMTFMFVFVSGAAKEENKLMDEIVPYVFHRMDALVADIIATKEVMITEEDTACFIPDSVGLRNKRMANLRKSVEQLTQKIDTLTIADSDKWQYKESLNAILVELNNKELPRDFIIQGTLLYLKQQAPKELSKEVLLVEKFVNDLL